jgi:AraC-like DNA-binding protein
MADLSQLPVLTPDVILANSPLPPPAGPVRLTLRETPLRERPSAMAECFARIGYRYEISPLADVPFEADLALNMLPNVLVAEGRLYGSRNRRTKSIVDDDQDEALLLINLHGPHLIEQFSREVVLGDGDAILVSGTDPSCFTHKPPGDLLGLRVPKSRLTPLLLNRDGSYMQRIPSTNAALALLRNYVGLTWDSAVAASQAVQRAMSDHIIDLVALTVGATRDVTESVQGNSLHATKLQAIKQAIARDLDSPDLSVGMLARRHGLIPRSLQRLFEAESTTFTKYVLEQRLQRAHGMLVNRHGGSAKISTVAYDCGFGDVSYFNRAFRQHFGASPSDIRAGVR